MCNHSPVAFINVEALAGGHGTKFLKDAGPGLHGSFLTRFHDLLDAGGGISTNILSDRLSRLEAQQIASRQKDPVNGRRVTHELIDKGKGLLPVMLAVIGWFEKYDPETDVSREFAERVPIGPLGVLDETLDAMKRSCPSTAPPALVDWITDSQI